MAGFAAHARYFVHEFVPVASQQFLRSQGIFENVVQRRDCEPVKGENVRHAANRPVRQLAAGTQFFILPEVQVRSLVRTVALSG